MRLPRLGTSGTQPHFILEKKGQNKIKMDPVGASKRTPRPQNLFWSTGGGYSTLLKFVRVILAASAMQ